MSYIVIGYGDCVAPLQKVEIDCPRSEGMGGNA